MSTPTTQAEFEAQQAQAELARVEQAQAVEDRGHAVRVLANQTGLDPDGLFQALADGGARVVKFKTDGTFEPVAGGFYTRVAGRPDGFALLPTGENLPAGVEAVEEAKLAELIQGAADERAAARRIAGVAAMNPMSQAAAEQERQRIEMDERAQLALVESSLPALVEREVAHTGLTDEERRQLQAAFATHSDGSNPRALDEVFLVRESVVHPGTGEAGSAYRFLCWSPEADQELDLEDRPGHNVRSLRQLAEATRAKHVAITRYGERALAAAPQAFGGPVF